MDGLTEDFGSGADCGVGGKCCVSEGFEGGREGGRDGREGEGRNVPSKPVLSGSTWRAFTLPSSISRA